MSLEQGLMVIQSNYEIVSQVDTGSQIVVTTLSDLKLAECAALNRLGWVIQAHNVACFNKQEPPEEDAPVTAPLEPEPPEDTLALCIMPPDQPDSTETE